MIDLPAPVVDALAELLEPAADGQPALVLRSPENLTTEQAAAVLGLSRPTVVRLVEPGRLRPGWSGHIAGSPSATCSPTAKPRHGGGPMLSTT